MRWRDIVNADLLANWGQGGWRGFVSASLYHPGFSTVFHHRLAQALWARGHRRLAQVLWKRNVLRSGCHLHLDAVIGPGLSLPHPVGIVVGSGVVLGQGVTLYQHVTLGRGRGRSQYPVVGDHAVLYPQAVVAGGVRIGAGATVGACSLVMDDVPPGAVVRGVATPVPGPGLAGVDGHEAPH